MSYKIDKLPRKISSLQCVFACDEILRLVQLKLMRAYEIRPPTDNHGVDRIFY
jgi:hypothetical protein